MTTKVLHQPEDFESSPYLPTIIEDEPAALTEEAPPGDHMEDFRAAHQSQEFAQLKQRFRAFAFPMTAAFLIWFFVYALGSTYAVSLMSTPVLGNLNLGLLIGLGQFATTFAITALYIRHANKNLDPIATSLREDLERKAA